MSQGMQRREFLRRGALVAAGVVAADQLDLLDRLGWKRKLFPSANFSPYNPAKFTHGDLWASSGNMWLAMNFNGRLVAVPMYFT